MISAATLLEFRQSRRIGVGININGLYFVGAISVKLLHAIRWVSAKMDSGVLVISRGTVPGGLSFLLSRRIRWRG